MSITKTITIAVAILAIGITVALWSTANTAVGSAPSGLQATVATSSLATVGALSITEVLPASSCSARIVSTQAQDIMLSFGEKNASTTGQEWGLASSTLSQTFGHIQLASTTVVYDSGLYGCGSMHGYAGASTSITVTELR